MRRLPAGMRNSNPAVITALIESGADPGAHDEGGGTPLHAAAAAGSNPSVITALIEAGADPGARGAGGWTPLHVAAIRNSDPAVITALIEGGADPGARDDMGFTPFDYAREGGGAQGWPVGGPGNEALKGTKAYWLLNEARFE